ncbi:amidase [Paraphaeosphaeria sporulosa]
MVPLRMRKALAGKKIGILKMYIGGVDFDPTAKPHTPNLVASRADSLVEKLIVPPHHEVDMCKVMEYAWDDLLASNGDHNVATSLAQVDSGTIFPRPPGAIKDRYADDDPIVRHIDVEAHVTNGLVITHETPILGDALKNLKPKRKSDYEDWLAELGLDAVVWPCNGDVGKVDADVNNLSAADTWRNGVLYSNGDCAIRQLEIPTVSAPMGVMADMGMPFNLTFASKAYGMITTTSSAAAFVVKDKEGRRVNLSGTCGQDLVSLGVYVDGDEAENVKFGGGQWVDSAVTESV